MEICLSLKTFVCLSSIEIDSGDRLLSADPLNDVRPELDDGLPLRSAEWRSMRASYFAPLLQFFLNRIRPRKDVSDDQDRKGK
jgi:hypothetical protein